MTHDPACPDRPLRSGPAQRRRRRRSHRPHQRPRRDARRSRQPRARGPSAARPRRPAASGWATWCRPREKHRSCCWSSGRRDGDCGGCRLEGDKGEGSFRTNRSGPLPLEATNRLRVLLRGEGGRVTRVRTVSEDCGLDAGGLPFVWIDGVRAGRQRGLPREPSRRGRRAGQGPRGRRRSRPSPSPTTPRPTRRSTASWHADSPSTGASRRPSGWATRGAPGASRP